VSTVDTSTRRSPDRERPRAGARDEPVGAARAYRAMARRKRLVLGLLGVLTVLVFVGDLAVGAGTMPVPELLRALVTPGQVPRVDAQIVWNIRLPMSVTAVLVGASLAVAGAETQTILNNPLAEPYTLGISAASGFGAAISVITGISALPFGAMLGTAGSAWLFAMIACGGILLFSAIRGAGSESMILLGIAMVFLFNALLALMQYVASEVELQQVVFWTFGNLSRASWPQVGVIAAVIVILTPLLYRASWTLTAFRLGDDRARALGVSVARVRMFVLVGVSVLAATAVAFTGTIGFVGLVGPHIARIFVGEDQRYFLPASLLSGSVLLCGASLVSKLVVPGVIVPVGIITSLVGVPVFLIIIMSTRRRLWS
jgi:iron complex transport system permease protein